MAYGENGVKYWKLGISQEYSKLQTMRGWLPKDNTALHGI